MWMYNLRVRDNYQQFREMVSYISSDFSANYPQMTVEKYLRFMTDMKRVPQFDVEESINRLLECSTLMQLKTMKIKKLTRSQRLLLSCSAELLNT